MPSKQLDDRRFALFAALDVLTEYDAFAPDDADVWPLIIKAIRAVHDDTNRIDVLTEVHEGFADRSVYLSALMTSLERIQTLDVATSPLKRASIACEIAMDATTTDDKFDFPRILAQRTLLRASPGVAA